MSRITYITATLGSVHGTAELDVLDVTGVSIAPTPAITATFTLQLTATAHWEDMFTLDVTTTAAWSSSNTGVATVNAVGGLTGVAAGTSLITAVYGVHFTGSVTATIYSNHYNGLLNQSFVPDLTGGTPSFTGLTRSNGPNAQDQDGNSNAATTLTTQGGNSQHYVNIATAPNTYGAYGLFLKSTGSARYVTINRTGNATNWITIDLLSGSATGAGLFAPNTGTQASSYYYVKQAGNNFWYLGTEWGPNNVGNDGITISISPSATAAPQTMWNSTGDDVIVYGNAGTPYANEGPNTNLSSSNTFALWTQNSGTSNFTTSATLNPDQINTDATLWMGTASTSLIEIESGRIGGGNWTGIQWSIRARPGTYNYLGFFKGGTAQKGCVVDLANVSRTLNVGGGWEITPIVSDAGNGWVDILIQNSAEFGSSPFVLTMGDTAAHASLTSSGWTGSGTMYLWQGDVQ